MGNWWKLSERYKRALHIVMLRTYRPLIMHAGFFMTLSVSTFMGVSHFFIFQIFIIFYRNSLLKLKLISKDYKIRLFKKRYFSDNTNVIFVIYASSESVSR